MKRCILGKNEDVVKLFLAVCKLILLRFSNSCCQYFGHSLAPMIRIRQKAYRRLVQIVSWTHCRATVQSRIGEIHISMRHSIGRWAYRTFCALFGFAHNPSLTIELLKPSSVNRTNETKNEQKRLIRSYVDLRRSSH